MNESQKLEQPIENEPQEKQLTQVDLFRKLQSEIVELLRIHGIGAVTDKQYLRLEQQGEQVGIIFKMPDGNRTVVRLNSSLPTVIDEVESKIAPESIYTINRASDSTDFTFFPNLTEDEANVLHTGIEPIDGHIVIVQGEYVIVNREDNTYLASTFGIASCKGIIIFDSEMGRAAVTHSDTEYAIISLIQQMRADLIKAGSDPTKLKFYGTPNIDPQERQYVIDKLFSETTYELPSEFTFDCENGAISPFDIKSLPQSPNLDQRIEDEVNIRLEHTIPYIRKKVK